MWFAIQVCITKAWCALTGAHAIYLKDTDDNSIAVKVMREKFDPFEDCKIRYVRIWNYGFRECQNDGTVGGGGWVWRYVNEEMHVQHKLTHGNK